MVFDPETNQKFRAVHDYMTHIQRNTNFDGRGEDCFLQQPHKDNATSSIPSIIYRSGGVRLVRLL